MTAKQKLALAGGAAIALAVLIHQLTTFTPPPGWWGGAPTVIAPCPAIMPNIKPYQPFVQANPLDQRIYYFRVDGSIRWQTNLDYADGHIYDSLGADHSHGVKLLGMEAFYASGALCGQWPCYIFQAPFIDAPNDNHPEKTACAYYSQANGPASKPCPSSLALYPASMATAPQWTVGNAGRAAQIAQQCNVAIPSPTPTAVPVSPVPTAPPTVKPSSTSTPTVTRTPTKTVGMVCYTFTPTATPHIGPAPSKTLTPHIGP